MDFTKVCDPFIRQDFELTHNDLQDLLVDPKTYVTLQENGACWLRRHSRGTTDVAHKVVAVGSRSSNSAQKFIDAYLNGDKSVKACGSYAEVFADKVGI